MCMYIYIYVYNIYIYNIYIIYIYNAHYIHIPNTIIPMPSHAMALGLCQLRTRPLQQPLQFCAAYEAIAVLVQAVEAAAQQLGREQVAAWGRDGKLGS